MGFSSCSHGDSYLKMDGDAKSKISSPNGDNEQLRNNLWFKRAFRRSFIVFGR